MSLVEDIIQRDTRANQPVSAITGTLYYVTDEFVTERWNGSAWEDCSDSGIGTVDSDNVTYAPTTVADWDSAADPGDVEQALDQLAERVKDLEGVGSWALVDSWTFSVGVTEVVFDDLSAYSEIAVVISAITSANSGFKEVQVSTDNGSTFLTTSGDYIEFVAGGGVNNLTAAFPHTTAGTGAASGIAIISGFNLAAAKFYTLPSRGLAGIIPTTTALNALRVNNSGGGNLTAGTIKVYGR